MDTKKTAVILLLFLAPAIAVHSLTIDQQPTGWLPPDTAYIFNFTIENSGNPLTQLNISTPFSFTDYSINDTVLVCSQSGNLLNCTNTSLFSDGLSIRFNFSATTPSLTGSYEWIFNSLDNETAKNQTSVFSDVDASPPIFYDPTPTNNSFISGTSSELIQINVNETGIGLDTASVKYLWRQLPTGNYKEEVLSCFGQVCNATIDYSALTDSTIEFYFFGKDQYNNIANTSSSPYYFTIDKIPPNCSIIFPPDYYNASGTITINVSASDSTSGINHVDFFLNQTFLGNSTTSPHRLDLNTSLYGDGTYNITAKAYDGAGKEKSSTITIYIDNTPPEITIQNPTSAFYQTSSISLNYTATDLHGINSCWYEASFNSGMLASCNNLTINPNEGQNWIVVYANDTFGNIGNSVNLSFSIDTTPPVLTVHTPANNRNYSSITLQYTVHDTGAGMDKCWYHSNFGSSQIPSCNNITLTPGQGQNWIILYANDSLGNECNSTNITFNFDNIPPAITHHSPDSSIAPGKHLINFSVSDPSGISSVKLFVDGAGQSPVFSGGYYLLNYTFTSGSHEIKVIAKDSFGNNATSLQSIQASYPMPFGGSNYVPLMVPGNVKKKVYSWEVSIPSKIELTIGEESRFNIKITNTGDYPLSIYKIDFIDFPPSYHRHGTLPTIETGESAEIPVSTLLYNLTEPGNYSIKIKIDATALSYEANIKLTAKWRDAPLPKKKEKEIIKTFGGTPKGAMTPTGLFLLTKGQSMATVSILVILLLIGAGAISNIRKTTLRDHIFLRHEFVEYLDKKGIVTEEQLMRRLNLSKFRLRYFLRHCGIK